MREEVVEELVLTNLKMIKENVALKRQMGTKS